MKFEWDEVKRESNLRKHEIDFVDAPRIFAGPTATIIDQRKNYGEERLITLGLLDGIVIYVAHAERGDRIRIISMRKATKHETNYYLEQVGDQIGD